MVFPFLFTRSTFSNTVRRLNTCPHKSGARRQPQLWVRPCRRFPAATSFSVPQSHLHRHWVGIPRRPPGISSKTSQDPNLWPIKEGACLQVGIPHSVFHRPSVVRGTPASSDIWATVRPSLRYRCSISPFVNGLFRVICGTFRGNVYTHPILGTSRRESKMITRNQTKWAQPVAWAGSKGERGRNDADDISPDYQRIRYLVEFDWLT